MDLNQDAGIVVQRSMHSVDEAVRRLEEALKVRGIKLFAKIDHSGEAKQAGLSMPNTKLLIFGNPELGTAVMLAAPSAAIDLPLKILVAEDSMGSTWLSYNSTSYLQTRHGFPQELEKNVAGIANLANAATERPTS